MIERIQIVRTQAQPAAVIRLTIPRAEIQNVTGPVSEKGRVTASQLPAATVARTELNRPLGNR